MDLYSLKPTLLGIVIGLTLIGSSLILEIITRNWKLRMILTEKCKMYIKKKYVIIFGRLCLAALKHIQSVLSLIFIFFIHFAIMLSLLGIIISASTSVNEEDIANTNLEQAIIGMLVLLVFGFLNLSINYIGMKFYLKALKAYGYSIIMLFNVFNTQRYRKYSDKWWTQTLL
ncbi:hypothetical protein L2Z53_11970 (plasmid) [Macrococcoides canis]|uniref:hypothetical protein n=1 Tax=Macrococcoides canis TaxID=1855823 RepID=UPI001F3F9F8A|nr:hypothetical protein [Macrococcus canis]UJS29052.1 hypothetical protein L2Z53_11970 [Macrococcus canis]